jgi:hypothetical protein
MSSIYKTATLVKVRLPTSKYLTLKEFVRIRLRIKATLMDKSSMKLSLGPLIVTSADVSSGLRWGRLEILADNKYSNPSMRRINFPE